MKLCHANLLDCKCRPKEQHGVEFPVLYFCLVYPDSAGEIYNLEISVYTDKKKKPQQKTILSNWRPRKGSPSKRKYLNSNYSNPAKHHRKHCGSIPTHASKCWVGIHRPSCKVQWGALTSCQSGSREHQRFLALMSSNRNTFPCTTITDHMRSTALPPNPEIMRDIIPSTLEVVSEKP